MASTEQTLVRPDPLTRFCLAAIAVLLAVLVLGLWAEAPNAADRAAADGATTFGNAAAQRKELTAELQKIRESVQDLTALFRKGEAKVQLADGGAEAVEAGDGKVADKAAPAKRRR